MIVFGEFPFGTSASMRFRGSFAKLILSVGSVVIRRGDDVTYPIRRSPFRTGPSPGMSQLVMGVAATAVLSSQGRARCTAAKGA